MVFHRLVNVDILGLRTAKLYKFATDTIAGANVDVTVSVNRGWDNSSTTSPRGLPKKLTVGSTYTREGLLS